MQLPLLDPAQPLLDEVLALDIPNLTPLEAINKLYELQEKVRRRAESLDWSVNKGLIHPHSNSPPSKGRGQPPSPSTGEGQDGGEV